MEYKIQILVENFEEKHSLDNLPYLVQYVKVDFVGIVYENINWKELD
jgi:hypothetical protein